MPLTSKEIEENRKQNYKKYQAHIPKYLAIPFDEKMKKRRDKIHRMAKKQHRKIFEKKLKKL